LPKPGYVADLTLNAVSAPGAVSLVRSASELSTKIK